MFLKFICSKFKTCLNESRIFFCYIACFYEYMYPPFSSKGLIGNISNMHWKYSRIKVYKLLHFNPVFWKDSLKIDLHKFLGKTYEFKNLICTSRSILYIHSTV